MKTESAIYFFLSKIYYEWRLALFKEKWRKINHNNETIPNSIFPVNRVSVGNYTYGELNVYGFNDNNACLKIGNMCSIAGNVRFLLGGEHGLHFATTYPYEYKILGKVSPGVNDDTRGDIIVMDDVWIGDSAEILSGVKLGQGCVIGAHSIVRKDVPSYAIFAGGKIIGYRFQEEIRNKLIHLDFHNLCVNYQKWCNVTLNEDNINSFVSDMMI